jgi:hypothetical protein
MTPLKRKTSRPSFSDIANIWTMRSVLPAIAVMLVAAGIAGAASAGKTEFGNAGEFIEYCKDSDHSNDCIDQVALADIMAMIDPTGERCIHVTPLPQNSTSDDVKVGATRVVEYIVQHPELSSLRIYEAISQAEAALWPLSCKR